MMMRRISLWLSAILIVSACAAPITPTPDRTTPTRSAPASTPEPKRTPVSPRTPAAKAPANNRGGDATQSMTFTVPAHPIDVILGRPTQNSITASVLAYQDVEGYIEYGLSDYANQTNQQSFNANQPVDIVIASLQPDTAYTYRVRYRMGDTGDFAATEANTFHTQRAAGSPFTFTIQTDSHLDSNSDLNVYTQTLLNERADRPDFTIDLGDTFMTDKYQPYTTTEAQYQAQRYYFSLLGQTAPLYLVIGNHDGEDSSHGGKTSDIPTWSAQLRTTYFPNPVPDAFYSGNSTPAKTVGMLEDYYAWEWGDALFVVLDPYWFTPPAKGITDNWNRTLGEAQYAWLKKTLETSQAKWKFIFIHQLVGGAGKDGRGGVEAAPYFEWGGKNADGSDGFAQQRSGWPQPIHDLLVANHVAAVFHGHDHLFVKQDLDGIVYQEVPQPSSAHANATNSAADYGYVSGEVLGSPGHLRVTVASEQVTIEYVRSYLPQAEKSGQQNGQVDYTDTIHPR
jgi:hypothetical protein